MNLKDKVIAEIKKIYDPEIPVNIYELGLIYDIKIDEKNKGVYRIATMGRLAEIGIINWEIKEGISWYSINKQSKD